MGGRLSVIAKGRLLQLVDKNLEKPERAFLDELTNGQSMVVLGLNKQIIKQSQVDHVEKEIFGDGPTSGAWWPKEHEKQAIVRGGFITALQLSLEHNDENGQPKPVPIECYWVVGVDHFEIIVSDCAAQVNLFLLTPKPGPQLTPLPAGMMEDMWVVATEVRCDELYGMIPPNYGAAPPEPIPSVTGAKILRLWGY